MSFTIYLESSTVDSNQPSHDFELQFSRPLPLYNRQYEVALQNATLWNSIYNVDAINYQNATFSYTHPTLSPAPTVVTFPDGIYTVPQMSAFIEQTLIANGHAPLNAIGIILYPNFSTFKVEIQLPLVSGAPFTFIMTSKFQELLGFKPPTYIIGNTLAVSTYGNTTADITNGVNRFYVGCSLISGSGNYRNTLASNILYSFTINTPPSSQYIMEPVNRYFVPLDRFDYIDKIRMTIFDQLGRVQDLNGEPTSYTLIFRPMENYNLDKEA